MQEPADILGTLADVFTWVGFGGAVAFGILALIVRLTDGTWLPVRAVVEPVDGGAVVRWIDADGGVNEAPLSAHDRQRIGDHDMADIYARRGWRNRMRLTTVSPLQRVLTWLALGLGILGLLALIGGWVLLAVRG